MNRGNFANWLATLLIAALLPLRAFDALGVGLRHGVTLSASAAFSPPPANYQIRVAGFVQGSGQAQLSGSTLSITANVTQDGASCGSFSATNLAVDATSHFHGTGTIGTTSMTIGGRIDVPQQKETQLKTGRLVATFLTSTGSYGRIVGYIPPLPTANSDHDH